MENEHVSKIDSDAGPVQQRAQQPAQRDGSAGNGAEAGSALQLMMDASPRQRRLAHVAQLASMAGARPVAQLHAEEGANNTGLPEQLKSGIESLSGMSMDHVKVNYNSDKPAQLNAHAYAQGSEIHVAPGQEQHLPHEAWHVVQQAQGRVKPTMQLKEGIPVNDDAGLESEADEMGAKALKSGL